MKNNIFLDKGLRFEKKDVIVESFTEDMDVVNSVPVTVVVKNSNTELIAKTRTHHLAVGTLAECKNYVNQKLAETKTQFFIRKAYFIPSEKRILLSRFILN